MNFFKKPGTVAATQPAPMTREQMLAEINSKASDEELTLLVRLFRNDTKKRVALQQARNYL